LVLVDRTLDLASALTHPSTYAALVAETLPTSNDGTRVRVPAAAAAASGSGSAPAPTVMDLDAEADDFWARAASLPFGEAVELQCETRPRRRLLSLACLHIALLPTALLLVARLFHWLISRPFVAGCALCPSACSC
jgi:hypothetical protein